MKLIVALKITVIYTIEYTQSYKKHLLSSWRTPQKNIQYGEVVGLKSQNKNKYGPFNFSFLKVKLQ